MKIKIPENILEKDLEEAKKFKEDLDKKIAECEKKEDEDCFDLFDEQEQFLKEHISFFLMTKEMDKVSGRKEEETYNVSKVVISEKDHEKFIQHDIDILTLFKSDFYKEEKIKNDVSMIDFMYGFKTSNKVEEGFIYLEEGVFEKRDRNE